MKNINRLLIAAIFIMFLGCDAGGDDESSTSNPLPDAENVSAAVPPQGSSFACGEASIDLSTDNSVDNLSAEEGDTEEAKVINSAVKRAKSELSAQGFTNLTDFKVYKNSVVVAGCGNTVVIDNSTTNQTTSGDTNN